ncbi:5'-nucleotidase C-terminal domain-containing protein [Halosquirtibacter laminarini]|uniref:5'-nucleotidase C-terminal domain-containing protein n=1 Tax=Halosquirtibacter laminarini TaxID=3374600 RepID=A0AC61NIR4_9BACT|nr:5'-nucleotidase C-terminal domain-containing protein [Prolixibacteraceae bacterium]
MVKILNRYLSRWYLAAFLWGLLGTSCSTNTEPYSYKKASYKYYLVDNNYDSENKVSNLIKPYRDKLNKDMNRVIGEASVNMFKGRPEALLSNFCADLLLSEGKAYAKTHAEVDRIDFSMLNNGGLRVPISKGKITVENIFQLMPFENEVVLLQLSGAQAKQFLNYIAYRGGESVSGVRFVIHDKKADKVLLNNQKLNSSKMYWLITSDYIADGGDGSGALKKANKRINTGIKLRDLFITYIENQTKEGNNITSKLDGRIQNGK